MVMKLLLGALFIAMLSKFNRINADDGFKQLTSSTLGKYDRNTFTNVSGNTPEHFRKRSKRGSGMKPQSCKSCGLSNRKKRIRTSIIRGDDVTPPYKYPWMANVKKYVKIDEQHFVGYCTGAIITEYFVLTATHCVIKKRSPLEFIEPENVEVSFLTATYKVRRGPPVEKVIPHPKYEQFVKHDIALLKFKKKINCNRFTMPICLPPPLFEFPKNAIVTGSGWGLTVMGDQSSAANKLKEGKFMVESIDKCKTPPSMVNKMHYCMKGFRKQVTCNGDSGGPAFYQYRNRFYLVGVLTSGTCDTKFPYIIYTSVPYHLKWIYENMISS